jgi:uncharacterized protein (DUF433 family)
MLKKIRRIRRQERVWDILKNHNPELTRERFAEAYNEVNYLLYRK